MNEAAVRIVIRPSRPTPSRATRWLGLLCLPWALLVLIGGDSILGMVGLPPNERPPVLRALVVAVAVLPIALYAGSPWLGRLRPLRWLFATPQPEAELDADGVRLTLPGRADQYFSWSSVAALQASGNLERASILVGVDGRELATIPWPLAHPSTAFAGRPLAQQVVEIRPDRFVLTGSSWAGMADQFALRDPDAPAPPRQDDGKRQRVVIGAVIAVMALLSLIAAIAWLAWPVR